MASDMIDLIGGIIKIADKDIMGHYRRKQFYVDMIRIIPEIDLKDLEQFRVFSSSFEEALDSFKQEGP